MALSVAIPTLILNRIRGDLVCDSIRGLRFQIVKFYAAISSRCDCDYAPWASKVLVVHENQLKRFRATRFQHMSRIMLQHNALSCHLPRTLDGDVQMGTSVCAVGNHLQKPSPEWLSRDDRNGIFWSSGHEGIAVFAKLGVVAVMLAAGVWWKHDWRQSLAALANWHLKTGCQYLLKVCVSQLPYISCRVVVCVLFMMALLDWSYYACPRMLTLASACHVDSVELQWVVVLLWFEVSVRWHSLLKRWTPQRSLSGGAFLKHRRVWIIWIFLMLPLSSLAMLNMASKCIPDFLQVGEFWLQLVNLGIGVCQALMSSLVMPRIAGTFTPNKHFYFYTSIASILTGVCFPAACIVYFDYACLGRWTAWWDPCSWPKRWQFDMHDHRSEEF